MQRIALILKNCLDSQKAFWLILGLGFGLRLLFLLFSAGEPLTGDAFEYNHAAERMLAGSGYTSYWPPAMPAYLAIWKSIFGSGIWVSKLAMLPLFLALAWQCHRLMRSRSSLPIANFALLLLTLSPAFILHSILPLSQLPAALLLLLVWQQMQNCLDRLDWVAALKLGFALAVLVFVRPSALFLLALVPAWMGWRLRKEAGGAWRSALVAGLAGLLCFGMGLGLLAQYHGRFVLVNDANARNFYLGNTPWTDAYRTWELGSHWTQHPENPVGFRREMGEVEGLPLVQQSKLFMEKALAHIRADFPGFCWRTGSRMRVYWAFDSMAGSRLIVKGRPWAGFAVLGADALIWCLLGLTCLLAGTLVPAWFKSDVLKTGLLVLILAYAFPYFFSFSHPSYHLPIVPLLLIWAASGLNQITHLNSFRKKKKYTILALILFGLIQAEWIWKLL